MAEAVRDDKITLRQLPRKIISSAVYTLKVPNAFTLVKYDNRVSVLYSPTFEFINSTWRFRIDIPAIKPHKGFYVYLERVKFKKKKIKIFYEIELLNGKDEVYEGRADFEDFDEDEFRCLCEFWNMNPSYDTREVLTLTVLLMCVEGKRGREEENEAKCDKDGLVTSEMAEAVRNDKIMLRQLPRRGISSVIYTLEVPNVFTLAEYDNETSELYSPTFEFINSTWRFQINSITWDEEQKFLKISLRRINSRELKQRIFCEIEFLSEDEVYDNHANVKCFECDEERRKLFTFGLTHDKRNVLTFTVHLIYVESTSMRTGSILSLTDDLKDMLLNGQDHNLTFNVSGKHFQAHKDILRARSEVFRSMFTHDMLENNKGIINVPDIDPEVFEQLLFYIYTGKVETLDETNAFGLYYAADKYNLAALKEECCEFIKQYLTNTNVCDALNLASRHSDETLLNSAMIYFFSNVEDILLTEEWLLFLRDNLPVVNELISKSLKKIREKQTS